MFVNECLLEVPELSTYVDDPLMKAHRGDVREQFKRASSDSANAVAKPCGPRSWLRIDRNRQYMRKMTTKDE